MKTFILVIGLIGLLAVGCGGVTSSGDGGQGGSGGTSGGAGRGAAGRTGSAGRTGAAGQGGVGGQLAGIPAACQSCAVGMCQAQLLACAGSSVCNACVQNNYQTCVTTTNPQYQALCGCAKGPCSACAPYCP